MKRGTTVLESWSIKEKLCLSSAVLRSGDQNWMSVSRFLRVFGEQDRPSEWYSQKQCALQYESLLNNVGTSKRKKRSEKGVETVDTPSESIVRKLLQERLEELHRLLEEDRKEYIRIKKEIEDIESGAADDRLDEFEREIEEEKEREAARGSILRQHEERSRLEGGRIPDNNLELSETKVPTSPLLTSLLQSPSSYRSSSTVHNLLNPSPPATRVNESPTLSRLLESPAKQLEPTVLFTSPIKKEPVEEVVSEIVESKNTSEEPVLAPENTPVEIEGIGPKGVILKEFKTEVPDDNEDLQPKVVEGQEMDTDQDTALSIQSESTNPASDNIKTALVLPTKMEFEENDGEKEEQEQSSMSNLQDSDNLEDQHSMTVLDQQTVNMIVAGAGVISVSHDTSSEHLEEVTSSDIQHKDDSEAAESVKEDSLDDASDEVKEAEAAVSENNEADSSQSVEVDALNNFIIGPETPKDNYVVQVLCSTPENVLEDEAKTPDAKDDTNMSGLKENVKSGRGVEIDEDINMDGAVLEVGGEMVNLGGAVVVEEEEVDTVVHEVEVLESEENTPSGMSAEDEDSTQDTGISELKEVADTPDSEPHDESQEEDDAPTPKTSSNEENEREERDEEGKPQKDSASTLTESSAKNIEREQERERENKPESPSTVEEDSVSESVATSSGRRSVKKRLISGSDSKPSSPACHMLEDSKEYRAWKKSIMLVFNRLATHKFASIFLRPITNEQAPAYDTVIHRAVDLSTIKKRIETGDLRTTVDFQRDLLLMFQNAIMYNNCRTHVYEMASIMKNECMQHIELMVEAMGEGVPWGKGSVSTDKLNTRGRGEAPKRKRVSVEDGKQSVPLKRRKEEDGKQSVPLKRRKEAST